MSQQSNKLNLLSTQSLEEEDDDLVILPDVDNSELIARFQLSLVGRLFNKERRSVESLITLLPRPSIWDVEGRVRGVDLGNHRFQFDFDSEEDLQKVLSKRPCHYNKWAFALERWTPHVGDSFPNKMTFWVSATGIPTHYWLEPIFRALGKGLGLVGKVEAKAAKFELELDAERPIKFKLRAQIPSGEIVPVTLEYLNLHRWCHHCRLLSHEAETCPLLSDEQKKQHAKEKEAARDQGPYSRMEPVRNAENSKRVSLPVSNAPLQQERRQGDRSQRENRDSVWQRIDSRYAPREDHRRDYRQAPREFEKRPHQKETYNKRRYEESFASSRQREEERKGTSKHQPQKKNSEEELPPPASRAKQIIRPQVRLTDETVNDKPQEERSRTFSPEHVRERPYRLNISTKASADQKLKGKVSDLEPTSEEGSSVKKSLKFDGEKSVPLSNLQVSPLLFPSAKETEKAKSWYEQTLEEEELGNQETTSNLTKPMEFAMEAVDDPDAEKILEEEDWMVNDDNFDDDDLMEDDDLLIEDMDQEEASVVSAKPTAQEGHKNPEDRDRALELSIPNPQSDRCDESRPTQTPSRQRPSPSPARKKRGSPSPIATGVSLRQRNLLAGRASTKSSKSGASKNGPKAIGTQQAQVNATSDIKQAELFLKNTKKSAKVGSSKPPKIPG